MEGIILLKSKKCLMKFALKMQRKLRGFFFLLSSLNYKFLLEDAAAAAFIFIIFYSVIKAD
jgi:hypothetical protein